jgi:cytochrome c biogenesis protein CcdA
MAARDRQDDSQRARADDVVTFKNEADASTGLFDLRYLIGGLFTVYGVVLIVASFFVSNVKSGGMNINLWLGIAMLILGVLFLVWARSRPLHVEGKSALAQADEETPGRARRT